MPAGHARPDGTPFAQIETPEQAVILANAQHLVARWNNVVVAAKTGREQLAMTRATSKSWSSCPAGRGCGSATRSTSAPGPAKEPVAPGG